MVSIKNLLDDDDIEIVTESNSSNIDEHMVKIPWVEKYRPQKIADVMFQNDVKSMLLKALETGNMPHLLFHGPPGTGKTSTILAIARELFGPYKFRERVIELNASDERGINIVRNKIVMSAKKALSSKDPDYPSPPYRILILDEADAMTTEAQSALRKPLEEYSGITRFCFICNYINQIIDPISSRCVKFRFKPLDKESMLHKLIDIAQTEEINIDDICLNKIIDLAEGDMRKAITYLQNTQYLQKITPKDIYEIANYIPDKYFKKINALCILNNTESIVKIIYVADTLYKSGYPIHNIIKFLHTYIITHKTLNNKQKALICYILADTERKLIKGADKYIQLLNVLTLIKRISIGKLIEINPTHLL